MQTVWTPEHRFLVQKFKYTKTSPTNPYEHSKFTSFSSIISVKYTKKAASNVKKSVKSLYQELCSLYLYYNVDA